jgi:hypothetical protein
MATVSAVAAPTVGGKAAGKGYALDGADHIVLRVATAIAASRRLYGDGGSGTGATGAVRAPRERDGRDGSGTGAAGAERRR